MRIHVHDGSGHPFQVQLSRELARRGHTVQHTYATQWVSGHGRMTVGPDDPPTLRIEGVAAPVPYDKYSPRKRVVWELAYARAWQQVLEREPWDAVVSCNTQLLASTRMRRWFTRQGQPWLFWHQDIASFAFADEAARKLPGPAAHAVGTSLVRAEQRLVRDADAVVAIGDPFLAQYVEWGLPVEHVRVIPNWAPLDEIRPLDRDAVGEAWAGRHGVPTSPLRLLYAGMLGRKHNPQLLLDLVENLRSTGVDAQLVVVSEGPGADYLTERASDHVRVLPFQPAEDLPALLASGDIVAALLEPEASRFSIPSKVLSYLAAGRPVLTLAPDTNPCVADVTAGGGLVVSPDASGVSVATRWILDTAGSAEQRAQIGRRAREYAESKFDITDIADEFERELTKISCRGRESRVRMPEVRRAVRTRR